MIENQRLKNIKALIKEFSLTQSDFFEEYMLTAEEGDTTYYTAGIFLCENGCIDKYINIEEYWTKTFYAFVENIHGGDLFSKSLPFIKWEEMNPESFKQTALKIAEMYDFELFSLEGQKREKILETLKNLNLTYSVNIIDDFITSSVAMSKNVYVSFFSIERDSAIKNKWHKTN